MDYTGPIPEPKIINWNELNSEEKDSYLKTNAPTVDPKIFEETPQEIPEQSVKTDPESRSVDLLLSRIAALEKSLEKILSRQ